MSDPAPYRLVLVTLDGHVAGAWRRASRRLEEERPGLRLRLHSASEWGSGNGARERCRADLEKADLVVATQIFLDDHVRHLRPALEAARERCDAVVCLLSAPELVELTRMGGFEPGGEGSVLSGLLSRLRGRPAVERGGRTPGERQMRFLRRAPRLLRFVPGKAQDVRLYLQAMVYWLSASEPNLVGLVRSLLDRYGPAEQWHDPPPAREPVPYPEIGLYHPDLPGLGLAESIEEFSRRRTDDEPDRRRPGIEAAGTGDGRGEGPEGRVALLLLRSYLLAGNTDHYDGVIRALERRGLEVLPLFAGGLNARPAIERFLHDTERPVDVLLSLTGFSLVGGPAYNDAESAREVLADLDVPYLCAQPLEFQSVGEWREDPRGLNPLQATLMVAVPELDGATGPMVFAGREDGEGPPEPADTGPGTAVPAGGDGTGGAGPEDGRVRGHLAPVPERIERIAERVAGLARLRATPRSERKLAVVLFNFPPNAGHVGTAAFLSVFRSLHRLLRTLDEAGWEVEVPTDAGELEERIRAGNADRFGTPANVHARIPVEDHVRREPWLEEIEACWGAAPGRDLADGRELYVLGERFGNVFVGVQPPFGWEGDPMRLLFEGGYAPTHAFSAFYRWIREDFGAAAYLHFGTHGAAEFMPGKQVGLGPKCWPDRAIGDLPNFYLYAANNPSEGTLAKRRTAATLVTHLTPPVGRAGLYRGLLELRSTLDRWRAEESPDPDLVSGAREQAIALDLLPEDEAPWRDLAPREREDRLDDLLRRLHELEHALIPHGLHVLGEAPGEEERAGLLEALAEAEAVRTGVAGADPGPRPEPVERALAEAGRSVARKRTQRAVRAVETLGADRSAARDLVHRLSEIDARLRDNREMEGLLRALDGRFVPPAPGGDLLRNPEVLPTGRNLYGFDPYRVPDPVALRRGRRQAERLLARHREEGHGLPETVGLVLWGTDNLKTGGEPIAQALALLGAEPRFDGYGRLAGARLVDLAELDRPRIDVLITTSGVFRDLLPLQVRLLAEAAWLAADAEEPPERNFVRKHALACVAATDADLETAALRVFSNDRGAYGANVNLTVEDGTWESEEQLAETWIRRKSFAYGREGKPLPARSLLERSLADVDLSFQNLDSVETGVGDLDQYFDSLGGLSRAAMSERGAAAPVYVGDDTTGRGRIRTLREQMALETRTRALNPRWQEAMLRHGYEGVREIETRVTNALGWSATTGEVDPWVYRRLGEAYVLDDEMRARLAELNPAATARLADRLLEATDRGYWEPDDQTLESLREASYELEDRLEGIGSEEAAA